MVTYKDFADIFEFPNVMIAKAGLNWGVDIIDPSRVDEALAVLAEEDAEFGRKVAAFLEGCEIKKGHYTPGEITRDGEEEGMWWEFVPTHRSQFRWVKDK